MRKKVAVPAALLFLFRPDALEVPDAFRILADGAIAREFADARDVENCFLGPAQAVSVERRNLLVRPQIRFQIGEVKIAFTMRQEALGDPGVSTRFFR